MTRAEILSKSSFKVARECPRKLVYKTHRYPSLKDDDPYLKLLADGGFMVECIAKILYPEGIEVGFDGPSTEAFEKTVKLLERDDVTLFEGTLVSNGKLARVDILKRAGRMFQLIEVKSKSWDSDANERAQAQGYPSLFQIKSGKIRPEWRPYIEDVAYQTLILRELFPGEKIEPFLCLPDKAKTSGIDQLHAQFSIERDEGHDGQFRPIRVHFNGDEEALRADHFMTLVPVTDVVDLVMPEVELAAREFVALLANDVNAAAAHLNAKCKKCEYRIPSGQPNGFKECWGVLAGNGQPHILDLYSIGRVGGCKDPLVERLVADQRTNLIEIREDELVTAKGEVGTLNRRQLIQLENTRTNQQWVSPELGDIVRGFEFPLRFIDFEASQLAVPYHANMHPWQRVAFEWSCTSLCEDGSVEHAEWININDPFPNFEFAETLMECVGINGTFFMWSHFENTVLREVLGQMAARGYENRELAEWLDLIVRRHKEDAGYFVDMERLCKEHFFHPGMKGQTSIKKVVDAIWQSNQVLRAQFPEYIAYRDGRLLSPYESLSPIIINGREQEIVEGTGAIRAYQHMLYGTARDDEEARENWRRLLLQYCKLDTDSMLIIFNHWKEAA